MQNKHAIIIAKVNNVTLFCNCIEVDRVITKGIVNLIDDKIF